MDVQETRHEIANLRLTNLIFMGLCCRGSLITVSQIFASRENLGKMDSLCIYWHVRSGDTTSALVKRLKELVAQAVSDPTPGHFQTRFF